MLNFLRSSTAAETKTALTESIRPLPRKSVSLVLIAIVILAVGTTAFLSYRIVRRLILDSLKTNALLEVQKSGYEIDEWLTGLLAQVESVANHAAVRSMTWTTAKSFLQLEEDRLPDFTAFALVKPDGTYYTTKVDFVKGKTLNDRKHFHRAMAGKTTVSDLIIARSTGIRQIVLGAPIWSIPPLNREQISDDYAIVRARNLSAIGISVSPGEMPKVIGELFGTLSVKHIQEVVAKITNNKGSYAFALDSQGVLLAHPDQQLVEQAKSLLKAPDPNMAAIVQAMVKGERGVQLVQLSGNWVYVAYAPLGRSQWSIAQVIPRNYLEQQLHALNLLAAVLGVILLITTAIALRLIQLFEQTRLRAETEARQSQQLIQTLQELQQAQSQLIQSEKMSSLGQLVAGVAHEINNPVNFINGNLTHASEYTRDLLALVNLYQAHYPDPVTEIQTKAEDIDLEFLTADLPKMLTSMKMGADRIRQIVLSLRNFSRLDEAEMKPVDIHEGIDSTLLILQNRLKTRPEHPAIEVIKEYGNLPMVECYAGQLNQVFMNILSNAIDALEKYDDERSPEAVQQYPSTITIRTEVLDQSSVRICIADNGPGMSEDVRKRLFDPFFTTKPVGKGTGLGLSISYQIVVDKHGGMLHCESQLQQGTAFYVEIPVRQNKTSSKEPQVTAGV